MIAPHFGRCLGKPQRSSAAAAEAADEAAEAAAKAAPASEVKQFHAELFPPDADRDDAMPEPAAAAAAALAAATAAFAAYSRCKCKAKLNNKTANITRIKISPKERSDPNTKEVPKMKKQTMTKLPRVLRTQMKRQEPENKDLPRVIRTQLKKQEQRITGLHKEAHELREMLLDLAFTSVYMSWFVLEETH